MRRPVYGATAVCLDTASSPNYVKIIFWFSAATGWEPKFQPKAAEAKMKRVYFLATIAVLIVALAFACGGSKSSSGGSSGGSGCGSLGQPDVRRGCGENARRLHRGCPTGGGCDGTNCTVQLRGGAGKYADRLQHEVRLSRGA